MEEEEEEDELVVGCGGSERYLRQTRQKEAVKLKGRRSRRGRRRRAQV